ncbi:MAG: MOSC domain-containing protein [Candidatus Latescibacterota bacterium]|nr:MOSC domain-containing protein [Candidatus Latescibacterota bacterium]
MKVVSVNIGAESSLNHEGESLQTGIFKTPIEGPLFLTKTGFRGDVQVDRKNHGGPDKAVCVYCADHFPVWEEQTGSVFDPGIFGENLTVSGLTENTVGIGDVFLVGEALVQVSQPRQPCHKLSKKLGDLSFANRLIESGFTGFYFRILEAGFVGAGDEIAVVSECELSCSVKYANDVMYHRRDGSVGLDRLLSQDFLSKAWKHTLLAR